ncbi:hypothetical protein TVAG_337910 [Trichomonas vaginalis G3]|uniref:Uncharacterized protein n=1 Tax=Trichomonas vaginalis (strain ATCC PRA-98 / G3) TaxID=412133 RepID=A2FFF0_TRIV3|nr:hypothetical protein TVAG_337910 [Trichomonas vaginalis G3]|eukprot:XP_001309289.1 hypothetical protein [Trichomonas vaginalis G3]
MFSTQKKASSQKQWRKKKSPPNSHQKTNNEKGTNYPVSLFKGIKKIIKMGNRTNLPHGTFFKKFNGAERYSAAGAPRLPIITKGSLRAPENPSAEAFSFGLC